MNHHGTNNKAPGAKAMQLFQQKKYNEALAEYKELLPSYSELGFAYSMIALCLLNLNKPREADNYIMQGIRAEAGRSQLYYIAALVKMQLKDTASSEKYVNEAIRINALNADYHALLAGIQLKRKEWRAALESANWGLGAEPGHSGCIQAKKDALKGAGRGGWIARQLGHLNHFLNLRLNMFKKQLLHK